MDLPLNIRDMKLMGAVDARAIVPVEDVHGGLTIYYQGRPTHYLLAGEWYLASPGPADPNDAALGDGITDRASNRA
ncbi:MAG: hypothetical protein QF681_14575 [Vicinamibacterales bacterium]|jgi:hypothetical protein|nr:hypothetical protein [Vicinamibacterales bacterium]